MILLRFTVLVAILAVVVMYVLPCEEAPAGKQPSGRNVGPRSTPATVDTEDAADGHAQFGARAVVNRDDCSIPSDRSLLEPLDKHFGGIRQENLVADFFALPRFADLAELNQAIGSGRLQRVPETEAYGFDPTFAEVDPANRERYMHAQPYAREYINDLLSEGYRCFQEEFEASEYKKFFVSSMTRHGHYQKSLKRINRNAAKGDKPHNRTVHDSGAAFDVSGAILPLAVRNWIRYRLAKDEWNGLIQATEEHRKGGWNYCFHVMVYPERWTTELSEAAGAAKREATRTATRL